MTASPVPPGEPAATVRRMWKHVELEREHTSTVVPDPNGATGKGVLQVAKEHARFDIPAEDEQKWLNDFQLNGWQSITILDKCPDDCPALLAIGE